MKKIATILLVAILVVVGMMPAFAEAVTGDLNGDGKITITDVVKAARVVVGKDTIS